MSELRQYHPSLRVLQLKQSKNGWIFIGDTPKDFAILQSEPKMQQVFGKNVRVSLPKSYHSADATKGKILVFKGVSTSVNIDEFKELLEFNKITHAEAERMTSKRSGRDLPFIKIKCDDPKQAEALILGGFICQKTGIIFKVEEFRTTPSIQQCFKFQDFRHKAPNCTKKPKCVVCGEAHSHENFPNKKKGNQNVLIVEDLMSPTTKAVLLTRIKPSGSMWSKTSFICLNPKTSFTPPPPATHLISLPNKLFPW